MFFVLGAKHIYFKQYDKSVIDSLGTPYDYESVMHYSQCAFSRNGLPTIMVKQKGIRTRHIKFIYMSLEQSPCK